MYYKGKKIKSIKAFPNPKNKENLLGYDTSKPYLKIKFADKTKYKVRGELDLDDFTFSK